ncbi:ATP-citrate lyase beta-subunit [Trebouxia sp. C0010 RCD-2024]
MLSQSASLRCTPEPIEVRKLSGLPGVSRPVAARPIRQKRLSPYASSAEASPGQQRVRIKLKAYELPLLNQSVEQILYTAQSTGASVSGPVPLPTRIRKYTVLRSPHVNKDSREQFEMRTHHRLLDFHDPSSETMVALMELDLPEGVDVDVKLQ